LVQIGAFISLADASIVENVVIVIVWADAFVSTWVVEAGCWGDAASVVDSALIDVNADVQSFWGGVPGSGVVYVVIETVQSWSSST